MVSANGIHVTAIGRSHIFDRTYLGFDMKPEYENTARLIRDGFAGVTLGEGVGLWQGQALDDYADGAVRQFILLRKDDPDYEFERPQIKRALREFWTKDS